VEDPQLARRGAGPLGLSGGAAGAPPDEPAAEEESDDFLPPPPVETVRARASLSGDLEVFGMPGLLQNLQQSESSGHLVVRAASGAERAQLDLAEGRLAGCRCGELKGEAAFYQILETPSPGTFEFTRVPPGTIPPPPSGGDLLALLMEAMRRFDEFQRLRALVPDRAALALGEGKPSPPPGEADGELIRRLWTAVRRSASVGECEREAAVDSYRVRAVLAHWLEEGVLRVTLAEATAVPLSIAPRSRVG